MNDTPQPFLRACATELVKIIYVVIIHAFFYVHGAVCTKFSVHLVKCKSCFQALHHRMQSNATGSICHIISCFYFCDGRERVVKVSRGEGKSYYYIKPDFHRIGALLLADICGASASTDRIVKNTRLLLACVAKILQIPTR